MGISFTEVTFFMIWSYVELYFTFTVISLEPLTLENLLSKKRDMLENLGIIKHTQSYWNVMLVTNQDITQGIVQIKPICSQEKQN